MTVSTLAPIALFAYNRLDHLTHTINSLKANRGASRSELFIFCDGAKGEEDQAAVSEVQDYASHVQGFRNVTTFCNAKNKGLASSIIYGVNELFNQFSKLIVLEDDLVSSPYALSWFNDALNFYANRPEVFSISGYTYPSRTLPIPKDYPYGAFFSQRLCSWGWAMWKDRWGKIDWSIASDRQLMESKALQRGFKECGNDMWKMLQLQREGRIDSWAIQACFSQFINHGLTLHPVNSYIKNIGADGSGTHGSGEIARLDTDLSLCLESFDFPSEVFIDPAIQKALQKAYRSATGSYLKRIMRKSLRSFR